ncbi:MAG: PDZ domain-containing protein [candidate division WOR-3 bacterium]
MPFRLSFLPLLVCFSLVIAAKKDDKPREGWLGVVAEEMSSAMLAALGIEHGVLVAEVIKDGPGAKAGLKMGDVILEIGGEKVKSIRDLRRVVRLRPNERVELVYFRRQRHKRVIVELGERKRRELELPPSTEFLRSLGEAWRKLRSEWRKSMEIYREMLDSLQRQLEETKRELKELQRRLEEKDR